MNKLKNLLVFYVIPVLIMILLYVSASIQAEKYQSQTVDLKQYNAIINVEKKDFKSKAGEEIQIPMTIKNEGTMTWIKDDSNSINLSYHILNEKEEILLNDGLRNPLTKSVRSGEKIKLNANVESPYEEGIYYIEFDMVHEGVAWFEEKGSKSLKIKLEVK